MPPSHEHALPVYGMGFFARQPIFDAQNELWGYGLFFREGLESTAACFADQDRATRQVLAAALEFLGGEAARLCVQFTARAIQEELPLALPANRVVVDVSESVCADPEVLARLGRLKGEGYHLSVSDFSAQRECRELYALADLLWMDGLGAPERLLQLSGAAREFPALPAIKRVEDPARLALARELGFRLFQGYHFQQPQTVGVRKLSSNQLSRLKILQVLEQADPDIPALTETIRADVALSYRLLGFLNSAYFGFPDKVESVKQGLTLLGWNHLRTWLRLVVLTDLTPPEKTSELPRHATLRGRFLEAAARTRPGQSPETLFLMGQFSLLPAMLDVPMEQIVGQLPLAEGVRQALLGADNVFGQWLALARGFERGDWAVVDAALEGLGLDPVAVATAYAQAVEWTDDLFRSIC